MIELPEAHNLAAQLNEAVSGREIVNVIAAASPHKFAFFTGDPQDYPNTLTGQQFGAARALGGLVELEIGNLALVFGDGVNLRLVSPGQPLPPKHQLLIHTDGGGALVASVQMYGAMWLAPLGGLDSYYYDVAHDRPSPLTDSFGRTWFESLWDEAKPTLSAKAFLATEQRIPGLGNGVLQDILFNARVNPRSKIGALTDTDRTHLFCSVISTVSVMTAAGGRDTEKDLYGNPGGYRTILSSKTLLLPCLECGGSIVRQAYLGGNVYFCPTCQPLR